MPTMSFKQQTLQYHIKFKVIILFKVRCLETGGYLVNMETPEEAVFLKNLVTEMKTGSTYW